MSDQPETNNEIEPTVITLVLPTDTSKPATVTVRNGALGHMSTFHYDGFTDICAALNEGMTAFVGVQANPPKDIQSAKPEPKSKKKAKKQKAKGKAPYTLMDASGATRTLNKMLDPFDLQEQYHKSNPKFKFKELDEAIAVAQVLIEAGLEKQITITYSNGKAAKVLPEDETEDKDRVDHPPPDADDDSPNDDSDTDVDPIDDEAAASGTDPDDLPVNETPTSYSSTLNTDAKRAMFAVLDDEALTVTVYNDIQNQKKHGWKKNLMKQREVKSFIAVHVDGKEELVEQLYQIAFDSFEFDDTVELRTTSEATPAPVIQVLTSPEKAKRDDMPEYNEFSLATDDDDDSDSPSSIRSDISGEDNDIVVTASENEGQAALL